MRRLITILVLASSLLVASGTAWASSGSKAVADCNAHGKLTATYTEAQLRDALSTMPADIKEYTDCYDVIQHALLAQVSGSHPGGGTGGSSGSSSSFLPAWLIVVLVLLALSGLTLGAVAIRRRRTAP